MITLKELEMRKTLNKTRGMRGFTLLEMMVVIMIIGILSTSLVVMVPEFIDRAQMTASEKNMRDIYAAMLMYQEDHNGSWPNLGTAFLRFIAETGESSFRREFPPCLRGEPSKKCPAPRSSAGPF